MWLSLLTLEDRVRLKIHDLKQPELCSQQYACLPLAALPVVSTMLVANPHHTCWLFRHISMNISMGAMVHDVESAVLPG